MNRRSFLKLLGGAAAVAAVPYSLFAEPKPSVDLADISWDQAGTVEYNETLNVHVYTSVGTWTHEMPAMSQYKDGKIIIKAAETIVMDADRDFMVNKITASMPNSVFPELEFDCPINGPHPVHAGGTLTIEFADPVVEICG